MLTVLFISGLAVAGFSAARSTWSPCGLSMLSSITPFSESGRGARYAWTSAWFLVGAMVGGAWLGGVAAGLAALVAVSGLAGHPGLVGLVAAGSALAGAGIDAGVFGDVLPLIRRQVDDGWLSRYRPWCYGAGFGWQLGSGLATYLMTAGVVVTALLAALTGSPGAAVLIGTGFGVARGLTVLLTARCESPARLRALHRRLDVGRDVVRWAAIGCQASVSVWLLLAAARHVGSGPWWPKGVWLAILAAVVLPAVALALSIGFGVAAGTAGATVARTWRARGGLRPVGEHPLEL